MDEDMIHTQGAVKTNPAMPRSISAWQEAVMFCLLAFALSWAWWIFRLSPFMRFELPIQRSQLGPLDVQIGMFAPLMAALIMRLFISKEGLRGSLGIKRSWRLYAAAFFLPLVLGAAAFALSQVAGVATFAWKLDALLSAALTILFLALPAILTAVGEEFGWRGYLLPRLLKAGVVKGTLGMGLIWGTWHIPLLVASLTYPEQNGFLSILIFVCCTVMLSFFFTAFHHFSTGSVMIASVIHGSINLLSELSSPSMIINGSPFVTNPFGIPTSLLLFAAGATLLVMHRSHQGVK